MLQIVTILSIFLQYASTEAPVTGYLPSSKSNHFSKNYAPPAANVSFNFGFSPRISKNMLKDSLSAHDPQSSLIAKGQESFYSNKEFLQKIGTSNSNNFRSHNTNNVELKRYNSMQSYNSPHSSYGTPSYQPSSTTNAPYVKYGTPTEDSLPVIEENIVQRTNSPYSSYGTPSSYQPSSTTNAPYVNYGTPTEDSLPVIEENLVQRTNGHRYQPNHQTSEIQADDFPESRHLGYGSSRSSTELLKSDRKSEAYPYDFSYEVMAPESGVSLGHHESHDGSSAEGVYHNLLPDGRLLTVEYYADDGGFKPRLSYKTLHSSKSDNPGPY